VFSVFGNFYKESEGFEILILWGEVQGSWEKNFRFAIARHDDTPTLQI